MKIVQQIVIIGAQPLIHALHRHPLVVRLLFKVLRLALLLKPLVKHVQFIIFGAWTQTLVVIASHIVQA